MVASEQLDDLLADAVARLPARIARRRDLA
jgi:hypothetical protein